MASKSALRSASIKLAMLGKVVTKGLPTLQISSVLSSMRVVAQPCQRTKSVRSYSLGRAHWQATGEGGGHWEHDESMCSMVEFCPNHGQTEGMPEEKGRTTEEPSSRACHQPKSVYSSIPAFGKSQADQFALEHSQRPGTPTKKDVKYQTSVS